MTAAALVGNLALAATWCAVVRVVAAGWVAQRRADRLDACHRHSEAMGALAKAAGRPDV